MNDAIPIALLLFALGIASGGIGYCTKQDRLTPQEPLAVQCIKGKWADFEKCKELK